MLDRVEEVGVVDEGLGVALELSAVNRFLLVTEAALGAVSSAAFGSADFLAGSLNVVTSSSSAFVVCVVVVVAVVDLAPSGTKLTLTLVSSADSCFLVVVVVDTESSFLVANRSSRLALLRPIRSRLPPTDDIITPSYLNLEHSRVVI